MNFLVNSHMVVELRAFVRNNIYAPYRLAPLFVVRQEMIAMNDQEFDRLLQQLKDEIKQTEVVDAKGTELLRELDGDIHRLLERSVNQPETGNLQDALSHFEVTHPKLTALISRVLETLSNAGI